jgi:hypothetical protein
MFSDSPAPRGATKGVSRDEAEGRFRPYSFQPYPSMRHHPDGSSKRVENAEEDAALAEPWRKQPYPPIPVIAPPPEPTAAELKATIEGLLASRERLLAEIARLNQALDDAARLDAERNLQELRHLAAAGTPLIDAAAHAEPEAEATRTRFKAVRSK